MADPSELLEGGEEAGNEQYESLQIRRPVHFLLGFTSDDQMRRASLLLTLLPLLSGLPATGAERGDHLELPESHFSHSGVLARYEYEVNRALLSKSPFDPFVRMIALPSWWEEWLVEVDQPTNGLATVRVVEATRPVWNGGRPRKTGARRRVAQVQAATAADLRSAWLVMINGASSSELSSGFDGETYVFGAFVGGRGIVEGQIWSPPDGSRGGGLVNLAIKLRKYVDRRTPLVTESELSELARRVTNRGEAQ